MHHTFVCHTAILNRNCTGTHVQKITGVPPYWLFLKVFYRYCNVNWYSTEFLEQYKHLDCSKFLNVILSLFQLNPALHYSEYIVVAYNRYDIGVFQFDNSYYLY
jgi:hypothetical protein